MRKLTLVLAVAAVGLAFACAYLVNQIEIERGRTRAEVDARLELQNELREQYAGDNITSSMDGWFGGEFMASDMKGTPREEQIIAQMEDYSGRMVRGAASVLTESQLEVFTQLVDESLAQQRVQLMVEADVLGR